MIQQFMGDRLTLAEREDLEMKVFLRSNRLLTLIFCVFGLYCVFTESSSLQGTFGKRAFGLRVTDQDGRRIGAGRALGRYLAHIFSVWLWLIGFVMTAFNDRRQALHDILAGTVVVVGGKTEVAEYTRRPSA